MKRLTLILILVFAGSLIFLANLLPKEQLHRASWWQEMPDKAVRCQLCPFRCTLSPNQTSQCRVRKNIDGVLYTLNYAKVVSANPDPIEKKPLFHVLPGTGAFSIATAGCNLHCKFCQNWSISQASPDEVEYLYWKPEDIVAQAKKSRCASIAYTYNEPVIFYELMYDTASLARDAGILNVMVTSGYINEEPLKELCKVMDAIKVDFKGFSREFYQKVVFGDLQTVLNSMKTIKQAGVWLEIVNLVVPTLNDKPEDIRGLCLWVKENLGEDTPVHFTRFHPDYKLTNLPPTPVETLESAYKIAKEAGLKYVYVGNLPSDPKEDTYCPKCGKVLVKRKGFSVLEYNIDAGKCKFCQNPIPGIWYEGTLEILTERSSSPITDQKPN